MVIWADADKTNKKGHQNQGILGGFYSLYIFSKRQKKSLIEYTALRGMISKYIVKVTSEKIIVEI